MPDERLARQEGISVGTVEPATGDEVVITAAEDRICLAIRSEMGTWTTVVLKAGFAQRVAETLLVMIEKPGLARDAS